MRIGPSERLAPPAVAAGGATAPKAEGPASGDGPSPFAKILHGLGHELDRGEAVTRGALAAHGNLGPTELLALQASVYRYSETIDIASRLVDHATSGLKTVIQGGGQ